MPICSNCGAYYVRPPCPACEIGQAEEGKKQTPELRSEKVETAEPIKPATTTKESAKPRYTSVISKIASLANQIEEKNRVISELEAKITEQQNQIQTLKDEIAELKS